MSDTKVAMQHVLITLADGRRGVFAGPELIRKEEIDGGDAPRLVSIDFAPVEEVASADQKAPDGLGEKA